MNLAIADLQKPIVDSRDRIETCLDQLGAIYKTLPEFFSAEWNREEKVSASALSKVTPEVTIRDVVEFFDRKVLPVLCDLVVRLYVNDGKWERFDAIRRFDDSHRSRISERIIPILQSGLVVELNQFYSIQIQLSHIDDQDGQNLIGHALTVFGAVMGNPISMVRGASKIYNAVTGNTPKDQIKNKLCANSDAITEKIDERINEVRRLLMGMISSWITEEVAIEVQFSLRLNGLSAQNEALEGQLKAMNEKIATLENDSRVPPIIAPNNGNGSLKNYQQIASQSISGFQITIIVMLSFMTTALIVGVTMMAVHWNR